MAVRTHSRPNVARMPEVGGAGYIAGEANDGLVTVNGSAAARQVEVRHRALRITVAVVQSNADGTYRVNGVDPLQQYDVFGRDYLGVYNDTVMSRVTPEPYDVKSSTGAFTVNDPANTLDGAIEIFGGDPGHAVTVSSGSAPSGITFSVVTGGPPTYAHAARWLIAAGTTVAGTYTWTLKVTAPNGTSILIPCTATFT